MRATKCRTNPAITDRTGPNPQLPIVLVPRGGSPLNRAGFSHAGARRGSPSSHSTPACKRDYYRRVTFLVEATRRQKYLTRCTTCSAKRPPAIITATSLRPESLRCISAESLFAVDHKPLAHRARFLIQRCTRCREYFHYPRPCALIAGLQNTSGSKLVGA